MRTLLFIATSILLLSCGQGGAKKSQSQSRELSFQMPAIPAVYDTEQDRAEYLALHYWDNFDFSDTAYVEKPEVTEQAFANYINLLNHLPYKTGKKSIEGFIPKTEADSLVNSYFNDLLEKYLYDPNSPMRNEELYIPVLEYMVNNDKIDEIYKLRPRAQLAVALKNRVGETANDFSFTLASGKKMRLYGVKSDYVILFINNPDCNSCAELTEQIKESDIINPLVRGGRLKVVALYPDEDLEAWHNHRSDIPSEWINGYDETLTIRDEQLYDLKAIPSLYLLDKDKKVIIKDAASVAVLESYFENNL